MRRAQQPRPGQLRTVICESYKETSMSFVLVTMEVQRLGDLRARTVRSTKNELEVVIEAPQAEHKQVSMNACANETWWAQKVNGTGAASAGLASFAAHATRGMCGRGGGEIGVQRGVRPVGGAAPRSSAHLDERVERQRALSPRRARGARRPWIDSEIRISSLGKWEKMASAALVAMLTVAVLNLTNLTNTLREPTW